MATDRESTDRLCTQWTTSGKHNYAAVGGRDILIIVSDNSSPNPDVVPRRSQGELKDNERNKLDNQGIPRECHHDDLSIMKARYGQHPKSHILGVASGRELTCEDVKKKIASLIRDTDKEGGRLWVHMILSKNKTPPHPHPHTHIHADTHHVSILGKC